MPILEVKNLYKKFEKVDVLKGISFTLEKGQVLAIIGSSGSGKTTLLRCLNFLETADKGQIIVAGKTVFDSDSQKVLNEQELRQNRLHFGLVFQSFNLFPQYSVHKNITLAAELLEKERCKENKCSNEEKRAALSAISENADRLLAQVGLTDKRDSYPFELSGGQQQRAAIARALALSPDVLCFDEPTSALDPGLTGEVLKVIKNLKSSARTMIVVTHEMEFAKNVADEIIFMSDGIIEVRGDAAHIFENSTNEKLNAFLLKPPEEM